MKAAGQRVGGRGGGGGGGRSMGGPTYVRPPVTCYTDACEAPFQMWGQGAIPLRYVRRNLSSGGSIMEARKSYNHPKEVASPSSELKFNHVNSMYCIGNDTLINSFPEGVGGKVMQMMPPGHPRGFLYRKQSHLINTFIDKLPRWKAIGHNLDIILGKRKGLIFDGPTGTGKSALMCQATHFARARGILTVYIPNARDWSHGEWAWPSTLLPGFFDVPDASRAFLEYFSRAHTAQLKSMKLTPSITPTDLPVSFEESQPKNLCELCEWGYKQVAPASIDRQSVAMKYLFDELLAIKDIPILFVIDGYNLLTMDTHFRYPHPEFLKTKNSFEGSDVDLYPQETPRIPSSRLSFVRSLNKILLAGEENDQHRNKFFITATTRDFKKFDGVSGFADPTTDKDASSLDEYAPFDPETDTMLHPMKVDNFDEYEYRSYLRFLVNSGELAGFGWGPLWHYSSDFERKKYKIDFLSDRNPQRVIDHYHKEFLWRYEYKRVRQKQQLLQTQEARQEERRAGFERRRQQQQQGEHA